MIAAAIMMALAPAAPVGPQRFACDLALMTPQRQLTAFTPVTVSFVADGKTLRDIHVIDKGAILYPGGNLRFVQKPDAVSMEGVKTPDERPGEWSGVVEKKMYRLILKSGTLAKAVEIGIGREPAKETGRYELVWNASHQPEGLPQPISGSGIGNCGFAKDSQ